MNDQTEKKWGQFDFMSKMKWGIGYIKAAGTGPRGRACGQYAHLVEHLEPMARQGGDKIRMSHLFYCGEVVKLVGTIKTIKTTTPACSDFREAKDGEL